ncbi:YitT family protein [Gottfriedia acidiceleris]|uniref:YitT family protein n=1 Tax=Gottfriedia acidiceleris TaxID=371036 RepID=UPI000B448626|nr:YitT family protein [Gottfriedia acidiceleris]
MQRKITSIVLGSLLIGIGLNAFIVPLHLLNGGILGISLILNYIWGIKLGFLVFCLNLPIYLFTFIKNRSYFINSIIALIFTSVMIDLLMPFEGTIHLPILVSAFLGGLVIGSGIGIMIRKDTCPGGIDLIAFFLSKTFSVNFGLVILVIDSIIISLGIFFLKDIRVLYSILTVLGVAITTSILTTIKSISVLS